MSNRAHAATISKITKGDWGRIEFIPQSSSGICPLIGCSRPSTGDRSSSSHYSWLSSNPQRKRGRRHSSPSLTPFEVELFGADFRRACPGGINDWRAEPNSRGSRPDKPDGERGQTEVSWVADQLLIPPGQARRKSAPNSATSKSVSEGEPRQRPC